ncbi:ABC transporter permease [[Mycoplasma] imitans]|uniref:ABC transporter permease n=1 Tax=[Mycoplasma] imitans TaxID=29560 RepID=UPI000483B16C|nr:ABC transporter permease [[Mycoplasma] imitans]
MIRAKTTFGSLLIRNIKLFLRNKTRFFFILLGPVITLLVFILIIKRNSFDPGGRAVSFLTLSSLPIESQKSLRDLGAIELVYTTQFTTEVSNYIFNGTLLSGLISITALTTAVQLSQNIVQDREERILEDFFITPTKTTTVRLSYVVFNILFNLLITLSALLFIYIYIVARFPTSPFSKPQTILATIGVTILICLINSIFFVFIFSYIKKLSIFLVLTAMLSSAGGFLIGGYFPISLLPKGLSAAISLIPQTEASILLNNVSLDHDIITSSVNTLTAENVSVTLSNNDEKTLLMFFMDNAHMQKEQALQTANEIVEKLTDGINSGIRNYAKTTLVGQDVKPYVSAIYIVAMLGLFMFLLYAVKYSRKR